MLFYPILVRREADSWGEFVKDALPSFLNGSYAAAGEVAAERRFEENLGEDE